MEIFEVCYFGLVVSFDECFEIGLYEGGSVIVKNGLFVEKIGFGFFFE